MATFIQVDKNEFYTFYYNMVAEVNKSVEQEVGNVLNLRPITKSATNYINNMQGGNLGKSGPSSFGVFGDYNKSTGDAEFISAYEIAGIAATVNRELAEEILVLSNYYCPKNTGYLASTGRIEDMTDGSCKIFYDCPYAWFVHEFTWKQHNFPECAKFLTLAMQEVAVRHNLNVR